MRKLVSRKKIVIPYKAFIPPLNAYGPIEQPYMETLEKIAQVIQLGIRVQEVLKDGSKLNLDMLNFDKKVDSRSSLTTSYESIVPKKFGKKATITHVSDEDAEKASMKNVLAASTEKLAADTKKKKSVVERIETKDEGEPHKRYINTNVDEFDEK